MSFACVPSEALAAEEDHLAGQLGSLHQKWLLYVTVSVGKSVLPSSPAIAYLIPVGCPVNIEQRNETGLSKIFSMLYTSILLGTHFFSH